MSKLRRKSAAVSLEDPTPREYEAPQDSDDTTAVPRDATDFASHDSNAERASRERIAFRAYELYMARGGKDGRALDDWLEAEQELMQLTRGSRERQ